MLAAAISPPQAPSSGAAQCWLGWTALETDLTPLLSEPQSCHDFVGAIGQAAQDLLTLVRQDTDVALMHLIHATPSKIQRYGVLHAMHTAVLMALIARRKDWSPNKTVTAVQAALTMNLSITQLQVEMATQSEPLSEHQRHAIAAHPQESCEMLLALGVQDEDWLQAVAQHHEQPDGQGYPRGLTQLHQLADALRTCDVYGAKMSPRVTRKGLLSPRAAAQIFRQRSAGYFGATIIRELGLYPPGCVIELGTGELAVVVRRTHNPMAPDVVLIPRSSSPQTTALQRCSTSRGAGQGIVGAAQDQDWAGRIDPMALLALV